jgi:hypothetical protein
LVLSNASLNGSTKVLAFAAVVEVATGLALMTDPALVVSLLLGAEAAGAGAVLGRSALRCWRWAWRAGGATSAIPPLSAPPPSARC